MINLLIKLMNNKNIDGYIIPKNDEFFSEYAYPDRLRAISNFSGSAGFSIITHWLNYLFVDGRYLIQSKIESGKDFTIVEIPYMYPKDIINNKNLKKIGYDPSYSHLQRLKNTLEENFN